MSLCAHFLRSQLDGVGAVSGAVEHEWSQQTLKTIVILFAKFRGTSNHDEQSERWPLLQIANSSRRHCGSFSAPQPTAILFYRACPQLAKEIPFLRRRQGQKQKRRQLVQAAAPTAAAAWRLTTHAWTGGQRVPTHRSRGPARARVRHSEDGILPSDRDGKREEEIRCWHLPDGGPWRREAVRGEVGEEQWPAAAIDKVT